MSIEFIKKIWDQDRDLKTKGFYIEDLEITQALDGFSRKISSLDSVGDLLLADAETTKQLFKIASTRTGLKDFSCNLELGDLASDFLNHGNYLEYSLAATTLCVLGKSTKSHSNSSLPYRYLEIPKSMHSALDHVHCRIGSFEKAI